MAHNLDPADSPTAKAMDRAIDLAIEGKPPYAEHTAFVDTDSPHAGREITRALDEGYTAVLVAADGTERVLTAQTPPANAEKTAPLINRQSGDVARLVPRSAPIGTAVVGCGYWAHNLARNLAKSQAFHLRALYDHDAEPLRALSSSHPDARAVHDYEELLQVDAVDAVVIATPPQTHFQLAKQALEAGKHVLVEKPLAMSLADAHQLAALAEKNSLLLMPGHTYLYSPAVHMVRDLIQTEIIGDVHFITSSRMNLGKYQREGVIRDLAPDDISILLYWLDQPIISVAASASSVFQKGVPETAFLTITFAGGTTANVQLSWLAPRKVRQMIVVGSQRMVQYDDTATDEPVRVYDRGLDVSSPSAFGEHQLTYRTGDVVIPRVDPQEPLRLELQDFADAIHTGREPRSNLALGLDIVAAIELAEASLHDNNITLTPASLVA